MNTRKIPVIIAWGILILAATTFGVWWVMSLRDPYELAAFQERIASLGIAGWIVLLGMQYVRVVLAFIPGGPVQIVTGAILGPLGGVAVIVAGIVLANATIFALVRRFGQARSGFFHRGGNPFQIWLHRRSDKVCPAVKTCPVGAGSLSDPHRAGGCPHLYFRAHPVEILVVHVIKHSRENARHTDFGVRRGQYHPGWLLAEYGDAVRGSRVACAGGNNP